MVVGTKYSWIPLLGSSIFIRLRDNSVTEHPVTNCSWLTCSLLWRICQVRFLLFSPVIALHESPQVSQYQQCSTLQCDGFYFELVLMWGTSRVSPLTWLMLDDCRQQSTDDDPHLTPWQNELKKTGRIIPIEVEQDWATMGRQLLLIQKLSGFHKNCNYFIFAFIFEKYNSFVRTEQPLVDLDITHSTRGRGYLCSHCSGRPC